MPTKFIALVPDAHLSVEALVSEEGQAKLRWGPVLAEDTLAIDAGELARDLVPALRQAQHVGHAKAHGPDDVCLGEEPAVVACRGDDRPLRAAAAGGGGGGGQDRFLERDAQLLLSTRPAARHRTGPSHPLLRVGRRKADPAKPILRNEKRSYRFLRPGVTARYHRLQAE